MADPTATITALSPNNAATFASGIATIPISVTGSGKLPKEPPRDYQLLYTVSSAGASSTVTNGNRSAAGSQIPFSGGASAAVSSPADGWYQVTGTVSFQVQSGGVWTDPVVIATQTNWYKVGTAPNRAFGTIGNIQPCGQTLPKKAFTASALFTNFVVGVPGGHRFIFRNTIVVKDPDGTQKSTISTSTTPVSGGGQFQTTPSVAYDDPSAKVGTWTIVCTTEAKDIDVVGSDYEEIARQSCTFRIVTGSSGP